MLWKSILCREVWCMLLCVGTLEHVVCWNIETCVLEHWNMFIGTLEHWNMCIGTLEHVYWNMLCIVVCWNIGTCASGGWWWGDCPCQCCLPYMIPISQCIFNAQSCPVLPKVPNLGNLKWHILWNELQNFPKMLELAFVLSVLHHSVKF